MCIGQKKHCFSVEIIGSDCIIIWIFKKFQCTVNYKQMSEHNTTLLKSWDLPGSQGAGPGEVTVACSYQGEDMLVGPSCEDPCLVTEIEPPAQQAAPFRVPVKVVVDDARETQCNVAKKCCVLHHVWISCREDREMARGKKIWCHWTKGMRTRATGRDDERCTGRVRRVYPAAGEKGT